MEFTRLPGTEQIQRYRLEAVLPDGVAANESVRWPVGCRELSSERQDLDSQVRLRLDDDSNKEKNDPTKQQSVNRFLKRAFFWW